MYSIPCIDFRPCFDFVTLAASRESPLQSRQDVQRADRPSRTLSQFLLSCRTPSRQAIRKLLFCHFLRDDKHNTYLSEEVVIKVVLLLVCLRRHEVRVQLVSQVVTLVERHSRKCSFFFLKFKFLDVDFVEV